MIATALLLQAAMVGPPLVALPRVTPGPCRSGEGEEVVVCAEGRDRYRLPLRADRDDMAETAAARGSTLAAITPAGRCGLFAGERRCGKAEALRYGYGGGRDPLTVLGRLAGLKDEPAAAAPPLSRPR